MRTLAVILLTILFVVLFFGGAILGFFGFGISAGAFQAPPSLLGIPPIAIGVVGVVLFLASIGVTAYLWMEFPEVRGPTYRGW